jgi:hypothetical protein
MAEALPVGWVCLIAPGDRQTEMDARSKCFRDEYGPAFPGLVPQ